MFELRYDGRCLPLPPRVAREGEAVGAVDQLRITLEAARLAMDAAFAAAIRLPDDTPVLDIRYRWSAPLCCSRRPFGRVEQDGIATFHAARAMLALD